MEKTETVRVPFVPAFDTSFEFYLQPEVSETTYITLENDENGTVPPMTKSEKNLMVATVICEGPWDMDVSSVDLLLEVCIGNAWFLVLTCKLRQLLIMLNFRMIH